MQQVSSNVISLGRAVLAYDSMTIRAKHTLLSNATTAELIATKLLLETFHASEHKAIAVIALYIHINNRQFVAA